MKISKFAGNNSTKVEMGRITLYFSYETLIAIEVDNFRTVHENIWGTTTGKHLNAIDGGRNKEGRFSSVEFERQVKFIKEQFGL